MTITLKKYFIKIPNHTRVIYCKKKKMLTILGISSTKSIAVDVELMIKNNREIIISSLYFNKISSRKKRSLKKILGTTAALIKQLLIETSTKLFKKLNVVGVGYKMLVADEDLKQKTLVLRLGYSHQIYFKVSSEITFFCLKSTKLFIFGSSIHELNKESSFIRSFKKPEPYKGKGILYESEKIILKEGKKT